LSAQTARGADTALLKGSDAILGEHVGRGVADDAGEHRSGHPDAGYPSLFFRRNFDLRVGRPEFC